MLFDILCQVDLVPKKLSDLEFVLLKLFDDKIGTASNIQDVMVTLFEFFGSQRSFPHYDSDFGRLLLLSIVLVIHLRRVFKI